MAVRFHSLRDTAYISKPQQKPLPTIHASTSSFRQLLRLGDFDFAFNITRWNNDIYVEEDCALGAIGQWWSENPPPSSELLALLDAADWAEDLPERSSPSLSTTSTSCEDMNYYEGHEAAINRLLGDDDFFASPILLANPKSSSVLKPDQWPPNSKAKLTIQKPTLKRSRSVDASDLQIVPYRSYADKKTMRAFMESYQGRLSWRRHRQLLLSGFKLMLAHDLDVLVDETAGSTILFKPEATLTYTDKVDLWLEAILTGSDQIALIRKDDSATAIHEPQLRFIPSHKLRPEESTQQRTMIHSFRLLTFLAQNCAEGKRYRLFKDGRDQLVLLEADEFDELQSTEECQELAQRSDAAVHLSVAMECIKVASQLHNAKSDDVACRLLLSAQTAFQYAQSSSSQGSSSTPSDQLNDLIEARLWKYSLTGYQNKKINLTDLIAARKIYGYHHHLVNRTSIILDEIDFIHAAHSGINENLKALSPTPIQAARTVLISTLLRLDSLVHLQQDSEGLDGGKGGSKHHHHHHHHPHHHIKAAAAAAASPESHPHHHPDDESRVRAWIALGLSTEILTTYLRLSDIGNTLLQTLPKEASVIRAIQQNSSSWESLETLWQSGESGCGESAAMRQALNEYKLIIQENQISSLAQTSLFYMNDSREKIIKAVWCQWIRSGTALFRKEKKKEIGLKTRSERAERLTPTSSTGSASVSSSSTSYATSSCSATDTSVISPSPTLSTDTTSTSPSTTTTFASAIKALFEDADSYLSEGINHTDDDSDLFGSSLLLLGRIYNDLAVQDLFSLDVKRRRENLSRSISQLIFALHCLRLYFSIIVSRKNPRDTDGVGFKFVTDWLCTICLNLIRAIQLNSNNFRINSTDHLSGALFEAGCNPASDVTSLFSIGQYETYLGAMNLAKRLHTFSTTLKEYWKSTRKDSMIGASTTGGGSSGGGSSCGSNSSNTTAAPELPLQTGLSCDQLLPSKISVQPYFKFTFDQLSDVIRERIPYISMAMAVDMMQYSPAQRDLVSDTKWKHTQTHTNKKLDPSQLNILKSIDLPKIRQLALNPILYPKKCVRACFDLCDPLLNALWPDICSDLFPMDVEELAPHLNDLFITSSALIDGAEIRGEQKVLEDWLVEMAQKYPVKKDAIQKTQDDGVDVFNDLNLRQDLEDQVAKIDLEKIPREELERWVPGCIIDTSNLSLIKKALCLQRWPESLKTQDNAGSSTARSTSESPRGSPAGGSLVLLRSRLFDGGGERGDSRNIKDLPTLIQNHLKFAADNFRVDERESAAAHYHLGVYLATLVMQTNNSKEAGSTNLQAQLQTKLKLKWRSQAVEHLEKARFAFNPAYCLKDYVNVETALYHLLMDEQRYIEATALVLAGDLYATDCKNKQPMENVFEDSKYIIRTISEEAESGRDAAAAEASPSDALAPPATTPLEGSHAESNQSSHSQPPGQPKIEFIGVITLRNLASRSILSLLKSKDHQQTSTINQTIHNLSSKAKIISDKLNNMSVDQLKELYKKLIKNEQYHHFF